MRTNLLLLATSAVVLTARLAAAEPTVIAVQGDDIYVELGARDGVGAGAELELLHEVVATDPSTGVKLKDRFAIGTLAVVKSGERISVARAEPDLARRVLAGDHVRLVSAPRTFVDPWAARVDASRARAVAAAGPAVPAPSGKGVDHLTPTREAWERTLGQSPEARIAIWRELIAAQPKSPYRRVLENEITSLERQVAARDAALTRARSQRSDDRDPRIAELADALVRTTPTLEAGVLLAAPPPRAIPNRPLELSFLVARPGAIAEAWLYVRAPGAPGFRRLPLTPDGDAYLRATIDAADLLPGALAWYVEARGPGVDTEATPVVGSADAPRVLAVDADVTEAPIASGRSHIDAHVDYVDFDGRLDNGFDQYYQAELDFTYRFITPVYAVRLGFGTLSGMGGPKDVIDASPDLCLDEAGTYRCRKVTFSYVYSEVEFRLRPNVALLLRPQAGLLTTDEMASTTTDRCKTSDVAGCDFTTGFGGRARVRFGSETGTNLVIGAGFTRGVGTLLEAAYHWLPHPVVPVQLMVQVTDMPVPEDFGVRLIGDVGWRKLSWFYPSLRLSYQARDIDHAGVSGGFAMNFDW